MHVAVKSSEAHIFGVVFHLNQHLYQPICHNCQNLPPFRLSAQPWIRLRICNISNPKFKSRNSMLRCLQAAPVWATAWHTSKWLQNSSSHHHDHNSIPFPSKSPVDCSAVRQPGIDLPEDLAASNMSIGFMMFHAWNANASNYLIACFAVVQTVFPPQQPWMELNKIHIFSDLGSKQANKNTTCIPCKYLKCVAQSMQRYEWDTLYNSLSHVHLCYFPGVDSTIDNRDEKIRRSTLKLAIND